MLDTNRLLSPINSFPIPMRGNEIEDSGFNRAMSTFPIPMRGNEYESPKHMETRSDVSNPHEG